MNKENEPDGHISDDNEWLLEPMSGDNTTNGEFKDHHFLPISRWNSFKDLFREDSICLEIWSERINRTTGVKEVCGKAKCTACQTFARQQGIQVNIGFSGMGSIVRNEFRDQVRKHKHTKKHNKALLNWKAANGLAPEPSKFSGPSRKRPASQRILKKQLKKKKQDISKSRLSRVSHLHGIFLNDENALWVTCSNLEQFHTEFGAATKVDDAIANKNPSKWFEQIHPRTLNFIERFQFFEDESHPLEVKGSFIPSINGVYESKGMFNGHNYYQKATGQSMFYAEHSERWVISTKSLDPMRGVHFIDSDSDLPPNRGWYDFWRRTLSIQIIPGKRALPIRKVGNCLYASEKMSCASANFLEKANIEDQLQSDKVRILFALKEDEKDSKKVDKKKPMLQVVLQDGIRVTIPPGMYLVDSNYEPLTEALSTANLSLELEVGNYVVLSNKVKPTYGNWLYLAKALLTIANNFNQVLEHLNKRFTESKPAYLTLSQIISPDDPYVLSWNRKMRNHDETRKVFSRLIDTWFDPDKYVWWYLVQWERKYVEESTWLLWKDIEPILPKDVDPVQIHVTHVYDICNGNWEAVQKHFDYTMMELQMLHKSFTDSHSSVDLEVFDLVQKHGMDWDAIAAEQGVSKDIYREKWMKIMENSELFWTFWYEHRHVVCEIVKGIMALDEGDGVSGKEICTWIQKQESIPCGLELVSEILNKAIECGIVILGGKDHCVKVHHQRAKMLRKCFPTCFGIPKIPIAQLIYLGRESQHEPEELSRQSFSATVKPRLKKNWQPTEEVCLFMNVDKFTKEGKTDWAKVQSSMSFPRATAEIRRKYRTLTSKGVYSDLSLRKKPYGKRKASFHDRPSKRQKLNETRVEAEVPMQVDEKWHSWQDTAVCLICAFQMFELCGEVNKTKEEVRKRWVQILEGEVPNARRMFNGVIWDDIEKKFLVQFNHKGKFRFFGHFENPLRAAQCADEVLIKFGLRGFGLHGEQILSNLNFPQNRAALLTVPLLSNSFLYVSLSGDPKKPWRADMWLETSNSSHHVGNFETKEEAARAADAKAIEHAGVEANLNYYFDEPSPELCEAMKNTGPEFGNVASIEDYPSCSWSSRLEKFECSRLGYFPSTAAYIKKLKEARAHRGEKWIRIPPEDFMFRGVIWNEPMQEWYVSYKNDSGKKIKVGTYKNLIEAALAYDDAIRDNTNKGHLVNFALGHPVLSIWQLNDLKVSEKQKISTIQNTLPARKRDSDSSKTERLILETGIARLGYKEGDVCEWSLLLNSLVVLVGLFYHKTTSHDYYAPYQATWESKLYKTEGNDVMFLKAPRKIPLGKLHESVMRRFIHCGREGVMQDPAKWKQFWIDLKSTKLKKPPALETRFEILNTEAYHVSET